MLPLVSSGKWLKGKERTSCFLRVKVVLKEYVDYGRNFNHIAHTGNSRIGWRGNCKRIK
jgi:hypothetical protein